MKVCLVVLFICCAYGVDLEDSIYERLSTRTPYRFVGNEDTTLSDDRATCAKKVWMIVRHGTRLPEDDEIEFMAEEMPQIRDRILQESGS